MLVGGVSLQASACPSGSVTRLVIGGMASFVGSTVLPAHPNNKVTATGNNIWQRSMVHLPRTCDSCLSTPANQTNQLAPLNKRHLLADRHLSLVRVDHDVNRRRINHDRQQQRAQNVVALNSKSRCRQLLQSCRRTQSAELIRKSQRRAIASSSDDRKPQANARFPSATLTFNLPPSLRSPACPKAFTRTRTQLSATARCPR